MPEVLRSIGVAMLDADPNAAAPARAAFQEASALARAQDAAMLDLRVAVSEAAFANEVSEPPGAYHRLCAALAAIPEAADDATVRDAQGLIEGLGGQLGLRRSAGDDERFSRPLPPALGA